MFKLKEKLKFEDIDNPLLQPRDVKNVALVVMSGERGLCGAYNSKIIKMTENRIEELRSQGIEPKLIFIGKKAHDYFKKRPTDVIFDLNIPNSPTAQESQQIQKEILSLFYSGEVDKVELLYTNFVSLVSCEPRIRSLLPLNPTGMENELDEIFTLTTKDGKLQVDIEKTEKEEKSFSPDVFFEQEPSQLIGALMPLFLNAQIFRSMQESYASELASRMIAMKAASDNAKELIKDLEQ